jgi:hypothetical protein
LGIAHFKTDPRRVSGYQFIGLPLKDASQYQISTRSNVSAQQWGQYPERSSENIRKNSLVMTLRLIGKTGT